MHQAEPSRAASLPSALPFIVTLQNVFSNKRLSPSHLSARLYITPPLCCQDGFKFGCDANQGYWPQKNARNAKTLYFFFVFLAFFRGKNFRVQRGETRNRRQGCRRNLQARMPALRGRQQWMLNWRSLKAAATAKVHNRRKIFLR